MALWAQRAPSTPTSQVGQPPSKLSIAWHDELDVAAWFDRLPLSKSVPILAELVREELQRREDSANDVP